MMTHHIRWYPFILVYVQNPRWSFSNKMFWSLTFYPKLCSGISLLLYEAWSWKQRLKDLRICRDNWYFMVLLSFKILFKMENNYIVSLISNFDFNNLEKTSFLSFYFQKSTKFHITYNLTQNTSNFNFYLASVSLKSLMEITLDFKYA